AVDPSRGSVAGGHEALTSRRRDLGSVDSAEHGGRTGEAERGADRVALLAGMVRRRIARDVDAVADLRAQDVEDDRLLAQGRVADRHLGEGPEHAVDGPAAGELAFPTIDGAVLAELHRHRDVLHLDDDAP